MFLDRKNRAMYSYPTGGAPVIFNLNQGGHILSGKIILKGNVVVSGGSASGTVTGDGIVNLIKRLQLTCNRAAGSLYPGGKYVDLTARSLARYATIQRDGRYMAELNGSVLGSGAAGTYAIYLALPVYFADPLSRNPFATALNTSPGVFQSVQIQVDLAKDLSGVFAGNDRVVDFSGVTVQWADERLDLRDANGKPVQTSAVIQEDHIMEIATTFERAQDFALPTDGTFQQIFVMAEQGSAQTLSDSLLNRLVINGGNLQFDEFGPDIRQKMYDDAWFNPAQSGTGLYFLDFVNGLYQNSVPAAGLIAQWDVTNVSGANQDQFRIYTRRTLPFLG